LEHVLTTHQQTHLFPPDLPVLTSMNRTEAGREWLARLPALVEQAAEEWSLRLGTPVLGGSCSWVAPVTQADGSGAVLKVPFPDREAAGESEALRRWEGHGAIRVLRHDRETRALLLERCEPGGELGAAEHLPAEQRLLAGAEVLRELWSGGVGDGGGAAREREWERVGGGGSEQEQERVGGGSSALERVGDVTAEWADLAESRVERLRPDYDPGLVAHGVRLLRELPGSAAREVVVHGDFNPGNVLSAQRRPWLAVDPKPMLGDPAYDPWPLLEQIDPPLATANPGGVLAARLTLLAEALGEDAERIAAWGMARRVESALWSLDVGDGEWAPECMRAAAVLAELTGV
jgi:streptomycin 6-kinase